ncbi:MAG: hypothetical protein KC432_02735 [Thermomicrobiales bacterium]|nr:hypothetical protein [Thermomicrobiales bacterium]
MSLTPILTDALIAAILLEQRRELRPPSGWGYAAWPFRAEAALATLTPDGWCQVGWLERSNHRRVQHPPRIQIWWQVDTGEVRRSRLENPHHEEKRHDPNDGQYR